MSNVWRDVIVANPMSIESVRLRRRFSPMRGHLAHRTWIWVGVLTYICVLQLFTLGKPYLDGVVFSPFFFIGVQTVVFTLGIPATMYASIAGEREKGTWDLLVIAPVSNEQIVVGKFRSALSAIFFGYTAFLLLILSLIRDWNAMNWHDFLLAELVSLSFVSLVAAMTIFMSARAKKSLTALGVMLTILVLTLVGWGFAVTSPGNDGTLVMLDSLHPLYLIYRIAIYGSTWGPPSHGWIIPGDVWGWPQIVSYTFSIPIWLYWASKTLNFAEQNIRFAGVAK